MKIITVKGWNIMSRIKPIYAAVLFLMIVSLCACASAELSSDDAALSTVPEKATASTILEETTANIATAAPIVPRSQPKDEKATSAACVGVWRKAPDDKQGFTKVYSFDATGTFVSLVLDKVEHGTWSLENNMIVLQYDDDNKLLKMKLDMTNNPRIPGLILDDELYIAVEKEHLYFQTLSKSFKATADFAGQWKRTNVIRALDASLKIYQQTDSEFRFDIEAMYAAHSGSLSDTAYFIAPNQAFCFLESNDQGLLLFTLIDDEICLEYDGSIYALGFGANVTAHGTYTKNTPSYTNANIVNDMLPTQELKDKMCSLVGDFAYEQIILVMEWGIQYSSEVYTYSGFISGIGVGVDFLINEDGKIYCLGYGLDEPGYTFYTNDAKYKDTLPDWIEIWREKYELSFVYKSV